MKRLFFRCRLLFFFLSFLSCLRAQTVTDSAAIASAIWQQVELSDGVVWKKVHFQDLFHSQQEINLIELDLRNRHHGLSIAYVDSLERTSDMAGATAALAALNGSFFDTKKGGGVTAVKVNGRLVSHNRENDKKQLRTERANAALLLRGRRTKIVSDTDYKDTVWGEKLRYKNLMVSGPLLMDADTVVQLSKSAFNDNRHPRSAVAILPGRKMYLLTVDGRNANAAGMSLVELAYFLKQLGVRQAMNLDGGGSTTLYIKAMGDNGVVNYPSDNKKWDHQGERKVANCLLVH